MKLESVLKVAALAVAGVVSAESPLCPYIAR